MKKMLLTLFSAAAVCFLAACGPSALEIKEMSSECELNVEIRYVQNDSIALFVGNTIYVSTAQLVSGNLYPFSVSTRDPMNIDGRAPTDVVNSDAELAAYIGKRVPGATHFGIVMGDNVQNEIGFEPAEATNLFRGFFEKNYPGSSTGFFNEKNGELISAKKLY